MLHALYAQGDHEEVLGSGFRIADLRLRLPSGETKIPHGGLTLLSSINAGDGLVVRDCKACVIGRVLVRGELRCPTGRLEFSVDGRPYTLEVAFDREEPVPGLGLGRTMRAVEFTVLAVRPEDDPAGVVCSPEVLQRFRRRELETQAELSPQDLRDLLGPLEGLVPSVQLNAEGGFRERSG